MNKTAIKNFAIWARNKLIADISYKAGLLGITKKGIKSPLPQSTQTVQFFDIGTKEPSSISGIEIQQRKKLVEEIERKAKQSDYATAYKNVIEEVSYTWFNRLIAIRFMEVNDYLPTRIRVLSSESNGKAEPDLVTHALEANLDYSAYEKDRIIQLKHENKLDELFRVLFIKQCNALNSNLPELFENTSDYTELLLNVSFTDKEGVIFHLVNDIFEDDFNVSKEGQVEIIGWLYQYYNTEPKDEAFALLKNNVKITKERIPAATQLFTPDWIVRYMVENSLGRLWLEGHPNDELKENWEYYLDEAEQEEDVQKQLKKVRETYKTIKPEDIKVMDPAMGSGHILVYAFDVLMQIYESYGYSQRDAAKSIIKNNLYGLDIDNRAYQLAYFAVMMKARQYNRRILDSNISCNVYAIHESNNININHLKFYGFGLGDIERNTCILQIQGLLDTYESAKEYGSILNIENFNWELLRKFIKSIDVNGQMSLDTIGVEKTKAQICMLIKIGEVMTQKYDVVVTNPPYMGNAGFSDKLTSYCKEYYPISKNDLYSVMIEKCFYMTKNAGFTTMITMQSWLNAPTFKKFRRMFFSSGDTIVLNNLGSRAFEEIQGEKVKNTSFIVRNLRIPNWKPLFVDLTSYIGEDNKRLAFLKHGDLYKDTFQDDILLHESCLVVYKTKNTHEIYNPKTTLDKYCDVKRCIATGWDEGFIREWYEVNIDSVSDLQIQEEKKWYFVANGGSSRRWYGNISSVINWENDGRDIRKFHLETGKSTLRNIGFMFKEGLTYTYTSMGSGVFNARKIYPSMASIGVGPVIVNIIDEEYIHGFVNSVVFRWLLNTMYGIVSTFETGNLSKISCIYQPESQIYSAVSRCVDLAKTDWDSFETSVDFIRHPFVNGFKTIAEAHVHWENSCNERFFQMRIDEENLNRIFIDIYGLQNELSPDIEDKGIDLYKSVLEHDIRSFISYSVGCIFGRYSLDVEGLVFAGGQWDSLKYNRFMPDIDNIIPITDEQYFQDDIVGRFVDFVKVVYGTETLEANLDFISNAIGKKGKSSREIIRNYFLKDFYKDHCQVYQRKPIYWLFDSGKKNGFKALIYMHRYDENTIGNLRIDYLHRMQRIYENEIARMQDTIENSKDAREVTAAAKRKEKLIKQLQETKEYDEKIAHLALARISIDLDDGVKVNYEKVQTDRDGKKLDVLAKI